MSFKAVGLLEGEAWRWHSAAENACFGYSGSMTTSQQMDAIELAKYRRRSLPDTPETRAYVDMLAEVAAFQDALVQANPTAEQVEQLAASLGEMRQILEG